MLNITLLVYVGHLAVAVTLRAPALPLLPLTSPPAALRPAMTVGAPGTEALGFVTTDPPAALALTALVTRAKADLTLGGLTHEQGHYGTLCGRREDVISVEAHGLLHYCPLEDGLDI